MKTNFLKLTRVFFITLIILGVCTALVLAASRDIVVWDFDNSNTDPSMDEPASSGGTAATATGGTGLTSEDYYGGNPSSGEAWAFATWGTNNNRNDDDYFQFRIDSSNFGGLTLSFDDDASGTGPTKYDVRYSIDGGTNWTDVATEESAHGSFASSPMNTHALGVAAGSSNVIIRIYGYGASSSGGTWRIDNVKFFATTNANAVTVNKMTTSSSTTFVSLAAVFVLAGGLVIIRKRK